MGKIITAALSLFLAAPAMAGSATVTADSTFVRHNPFMSTSEPRPFIIMYADREMNVNEVRGDWVKVNFTVQRGVDKIPLTGWVRRSDVEIDGQVVELDAPARPAGNEPADDEAWGDELASAVSGSGAEASSSGWDSESSSEAPSNALPSDEFGGIDLGGDTEDMALSGGSGDEFGGDDDFSGADSFEDPQEPDWDDL